LQWLNQVYGASAGCGIAAAQPPYNTALMNVPTLPALQGTFTTAGFALNVSSIYRLPLSIVDLSSPFAPSFALPNVNNNWTIAVGGPGQQGTNSAFNENPSWNYILQGLNLWVDLVLPSDPIRMKYKQAWMSPEGINYPFKRTLWQPTVITAPTNGNFQLQVQARVKSATSVIVVITSALYNTIGADNSIYNLPVLTSFMGVGLMEAFCQIGGQQYPATKINMNTGVIQQSHLPEMLSVLGRQRDKNYIQSVPMLKLNRLGREYGKVGDYGARTGTGNEVTGVNQVVCMDASTQSYGSFQETVSYTDTGGAKTLVGTVGGMKLPDTSNLILMFNLSRVDQDFLTGVDVANSGNMILNLTFSQWPWQAAAVPYVIHTFVVADAVFQMSESGQNVKM
jgi:hypothetical protein